MLGLCGILWREDEPGAFLCGAKGLHQKSVQERGLYDSGEGIPSILSDDAEKPREG